jgi:N-acetylmuramoyl-L-alanine amidase
MHFLRIGFLAVMLTLGATAFQSPRRPAVPKGGAPTAKAGAKKAPVEKAAAVRPPGEKTRVAETWVEAKPRAGDDVTTLLERYALYDHECNIEKFFQLNALKEDYRLRPNRAYKLPVKLVTYNGKTIRSTLNIDDWQLAKRIERYNQLIKDLKLRTDDFRTSRQLWVPWHELECPGQGEEARAIEARVEKKAGIKLSETESIKGSRNFPIFGRRYAHTPVVSKRLKGRVFYVVSGHGGPDVGAQGHRGGSKLCEDEYAYDVSLRLVRLLVGHGATVYMIVRDPDDGIRDTEILPCDKDEQVYGKLTIPRPQKERLRQRTDLINELTDRNLKAGITDQTIIEIHVDSRSRHTKTDVFFYFRPQSEPSRALARHIHRTFLQKYLKVRSSRNYSGTVTPRDLFTLRETATPKAVYIELGNIRNDWDQRRLVMPSNRQAVANWLCEALLTKK